jgi:hypothetical protein
MVTDTAFHRIPGITPAQTCLIGSTMAPWFRVVDGLAESTADLAGR